MNDFINKIKSNNRFNSAQRHQCGHRNQKKKQPKYDSEKPFLIQLTLDKQRHPVIRHHLILKLLP